MLKDLQKKEFEIQTANGNWYSMRILPYRTIENTIDGVVITFMDITQRKKAEQLGETARIYAESIVETVREPLVILDERLKVVSANRSFYKTFKTSPEETENMLIYNLGNGQWNIPKLRELLEEIIPRNNLFNDFEVSSQFPGHRTEDDAPECAHDRSGRPGETHSPCHRGYYRERATRSNRIAKRKRVPDEIKETGTENTF